ncbi:hypothetical protein FDP41_004773 [Naegleria fowleri]|uniref:Uncharacterized protein n=1 Tax=Naegleria fowleri TaxID=5763 RepID=A0A6A5BGJ3_NAEFO|nr:uncharacterized protein FDP41_004773 [Naegleria fowleri]KAF0976097.1 hypothetical protein FDP41_004773 [Naegleria fowleri]CAG4717459.1 unnamed protein product [Naegleria fowleri]
MILQSHVIPNLSDLNLMDYYLSERDWKSALFLLNKRLNRFMKMEKTENSSKNIPLDDDQNNIKMDIRALYLSGQLGLSTLFPIEKLVRLLTHRTDLSRFEQFVIWKTIARNLLDRKLMLEYEQCLLQMLKLLEDSDEVKWMLIDLYLNKKFSISLQEQTKARYITLSLQQQKERQRNELALSLVTKLENSSRVKLDPRLSLLLREYHAILLSRVAIKAIDIEEGKKIVHELIDHIENNSALEEDKNDSLAHYHHLLSTMNFKQGKFVEALEESKKALSLNPKSTFYQNRHHGMIETFKNHTQQLSILNELPPNELMSTSMTTTPLSQKNLLQLGECSVVRERYE